jgi:DNA-binding transcriptional regulator YiaG
VGFLVEASMTCEAEFTRRFREGCEALGLSDAEAAVVFDTSTPTAGRWRRGVVVPLVAALVLRRLAEVCAERGVAVPS